MAQKFRKNFKVCVTCEYWAGSRQLDTFRIDAIVDSISSKGKCTLEGAFKGLDKSANGTCNKWQVWGAMK
jgi:hypothetical protein